jgi:hypothetical protein
VEQFTEKVMPFIRRGPKGKGFKNPTRMQQPLDSNWCALVAADIAIAFLLNECNIELSKITFLDVYGGLKRYGAGKLGVNYVPTEDKPEMINILEGGITHTEIWTNAVGGASTEMKLRAGKYSLPDAVNKISPYYNKLCVKIKGSGPAFDPQIVSRIYQGNLSSPLESRQEDPLKKWWYDSANPKAGAYTAVYRALQRQNCIVLMATRGLPSSALYNHVVVAVGYDDFAESILVYDPYPGWYMHEIKTEGFVKLQRLVTKCSIISY